MNNKPHQIRIRGPWNFSTSDGETGVVKMPGVWLKRDVSLQLNRKFNWLADLDDGETVFLIFEGYGGRGHLRVNDQQLGSLDGSTAAFEVTELLRPSNMIDLELSFGDLADDIPAGLWGEVRLEVRS
jgi:hypothetical protein